VIIKKTITRGAKAVAPARFGRPGYTLLEVQVAFAVLGIGLAGLCPLVVMQLRQVRQLELRLEGQVVQKSFLTGQNQTMLPGINYYIVPWTNPLAQKLAGSGQILTSSTNACDPGPLQLPTLAPPSFPVSIVELDATPTGQSVTAYVIVTAP
jgi:type II secretory pathway pseudopilin PulG